MKETETPPLFKKIFLTGLPIFFLILWALLSLDYIKKADYGLLSLNGRFKLNSFSKIQTGELLAGGIAAGEIVSPYPNLEFLGIRFDTLYRINDDTLKVRIESEGQKIEKELKTKDLQNQKISYFSLSPLSVQKNSPIKFEIESTQGATGSAIAISIKNPVIVTVHPYSFPSILRNFKTLKYFFKNKFLNLSGNPDVMTNIFIFSLPFWFYYLVLFLKKDFQVLSILLIFIVINDVLNGKQFYDFLYVSVFLGWIMLFIKNNIEGRSLGFLTIVTSITMVVASMFGDNKLAERSATWVFIHLVTIVTLSLLEIPKEQEALVDPIAYLRNLISVHRYDLSPINRIPTIYIPLHKLVIKYGRTLLDRILRPVVYFYSAWIILQSLKQLIVYKTIYSDFFPETGVSLFISQTAFPILLLYIFGLLCLYFLIKHTLKTRPYIILALAIVISSFQSTIYNSTTHFKEGVAIVSVQPAETAEPWVDVTLKGRNFRERPFIGKVYVNNVEQRILSWENEGIVFRTNPLTTRSGLIKVITENGKESNGIQFKYTGNR